MGRPGCSARSGGGGEGGGGGGDGDGGEGSGDGGEGGGGAGGAGGGGGGGHGSGGGEGCRMTVPAAKSGEAWRAVSIRRACSAQLSHCDCDYDYCYYCYYCYYYYYYLLLSGSSPTSYYYHCLLPAARSSLAPRRCLRC